MSAILETAPPARAYTRGPIWLTIETDAAIAARATVAITISSTGPTAGQTFRIQWGGNDLTFTVTDPLTASSLLWPLHDGSESLTTYADRVAERLAGNVKYWRIEAETDHARWLRVLEENDALKKKGGQS